jgi:hypothetical protein
MKIDLITKRRKDFTEADSFLLELAMDLGFVVLDDDLTEYKCSDEFLIEFARRIITSTRKRIWDIIEERIDKHPTDGLSAEGVYSENIAAQQRSFLHGLRAGRVAAIRCCERAERAQ